jgi:hypothetical protein
MLIVFAGSELEFVDEDVVPGPDDVWDAGALMSLAAVRASEVEGVVGGVVLEVGSAEVWGSGDVRIEEELGLMFASEPWKAGWRMFNDLVIVADSNS